MSKPLIQRRSGNIAAAAVGASRQQSRLTQDAVDRMSAAERAALAELLGARKKELGLTQAEIAQRAGKSVDAVGRLLRAEQDNPEYAVLRAVARALDLPLALMLGMANPLPAAEEAIPLAGQAEVGVYRSGKKQPNGAVARIGLPVDARLAGNQRIAVTIMDDSLTGLSPPIPAGHIALVAVLRPGEFDIEHGRIYLIHRPNHDGAIETSFRRAAVYPDRYEFAPASRDVERNERETITVLRSEFQTSDLEIGGLFFASYCQYA